MVWIMTNNVSKRLSFPANVTPKCLANGTSAALDNRQNAWRAATLMIGSSGPAAKGRKAMQNSGFEGAYAAACDTSAFQVTKQATHEDKS